MRTQLGGTLALGLGSVTDLLRRGRMSWEMGGRVCGA
jgi:hypothetical protein